MGDETVEKYTYVGICTCEIDLWRKISVLMLSEEKNEFDFFFQTKISSILTPKMTFLVRLTTCTHDT